MKLIYVVVSAGLLAACGGGDKAKTPPEKCHDLIDIVCDRIIDCTSPPPTKADCVAQLEPSLPCDSAKSVSMTYDSCVDHLNNDTCDVLFQPDQNGDLQLVLPNDCQGVIMARQAPVETSSPLVEETQSFIDVQ